VIKIKKRLVEPFKENYIIIIKKSNALADTFDHRVYRSVVRVLELEDFSHGEDEIGFAKKKFWKNKVVWLRSRVCLPDRQAGNHAAYFPATA